MRYYTYILYSPGHDQFYYGQTQDLESRLEKHNHGQVRSTKRYVPWVLYAYLELSSRSESMAMEKKLKNLHGKERLHDFITRQHFVYKGLHDWGSQEVIGPEF